MADNPYSPPASRLRDKAPAPASAATALLAGAGVELGGMLVVGLVLTVVLTLYLEVNGASADDMSKILDDESPSSLFSLMLIGLGSIVTLLAGYVSARIWRRRSFRLATILLGFDVVLSLLLSWDDYTLAQHAMLAAVSALTIFVGTALGMPKQALALA